MRLLQICESQQHISLKLLPKRQARILRHTLEVLYASIRPGKWSKHVFFLLFVQLVAMSLNLM